MRFRKYYSLAKSNSKAVRKSSQIDLKLIVPAVESKAVAPLSPILGQYGLSCSDFCVKFNDETAELTANIPIRVKLTALILDREFNYKIIGLSFTRLIRQIYDDKIDVLGIYKLFICLKFLYGIKFTKSIDIDNAILCSLLGILNTMHMKIVLYY